MLGREPSQPPRVSYRDAATGQVVVSIPAMTDDPFWDTQRPVSNTRRAARAAAEAGVDTLLSVDGKRGRIAQVVKRGCPVTILTHWQSLYSDGTYAGLLGLERLVVRLRKVYGGSLRWTSCIELAEQTANENRS